MHTNKTKTIETDIKDDHHHHETEKSCCGNCSKDGLCTRFSFEEVETISVKSDKDQPLI